MGVYWHCQYLSVFVRIYLLLSLLENKKTPEKLRGQSYTLLIFTD